MLSKLRDNSGLAGLIVAVVAVFVALSGIAGALPGKNGVNSGDIKNNSIKSGDVKNDALTGSDVNEGTLKLPASAVTKSTFGVAVNGDASIKASNLPGTTAVDDGTGYTVTFPREVTNCIPVASDDNPPTVALRTDQPTGPTQKNQVFVLPADGANTPFNLIVNC